ncbi:polysaccharide deacetylase family protein [soil metagenome]
MKVREFAPFPTLSIVTYHNIADHELTFPHPEVIDATPRQFRSQMEILGRYCTPITIDDLVRALDGAPLPKNAVMVTFDDGYSSCHDVALPILRELGIPATFFIATQFVEERRLYWWERIALLVANGTKRGRIAYPSRMELMPRDSATRRRLDDIIKDTPNLDVDRFLAETAHALGVPWTPEIEAERTRGLIMTWDQVRALAAAGMDVESHSRSHRVLQTLEPDELRDELSGSRADLEARIGKKVRAIAYPVGRRVGRRARWIREALTQAGYLIGLTNASGVNRIWPGSMRRMMPFERFDVHRLSLDRSISDAMFLTQIALPRFAYIGRHEPD